MWLGSVSHTSRLVELGLGLLVQLVNQNTFLCSCLFNVHLSVYIHISAYSMCSVLTGSVSTQGSELLYDVEVPGPPSVLQLYDKDGGKSPWSQSST